MFCAKLRNEVPPARPSKISDSAFCWSAVPRSSTYKHTRHGLLGSSSRYEPAMTAERPDRFTSSERPARTCHERAKSHTPYVDPLPVRTPSRRRQGQIASQLHASKYEPDTRQFGMIALRLKPPRHLAAKQPRRWEPQPWNSINASC